MGVGLSISRSIIEAHDGRLWASANDGPGLTFFASLPVGAGDGEDPKPVGADTVPVSRSDNVQA
jgi:signal transduction histidine kinase